MQEHQLLTLHEVASKTGYHTDTLRQYAIAGKIPAKKLGRDWFVLSTDVKYIEARRDRFGNRTGNVKPLFKEDHASSTTGHD